MLHKKENILRNGARDSLARYLTLELETFLVAHPAEPNNPQLALGHND